ncbi:hypothetical protein T265_09311 [Opisthorchis viverrini]|uniref:Uncharacterized protein n=1 Tax=Opisthorchis viverrini TaxID=6198 RepID=A0A074ZAV1_OPIVI|nr:hypothetical protein T265_09311 [Opisthorchis viverrini]KER22652.1 hypothetical protein T265_09311 [Opisthorchis viverrini]
MTSHVRRHGVSNKELYNDSSIYCVRTMVKPPQGIHCRSGGKLNDWLNMGKGNVEQLDLSKEFHQ